MKFLTLFFIFSLSVPVLASEATYPGMFGDVDDGLPPVISSPKIIVRKPVKKQQKRGQGMQSIGGKTSGLPGRKAQKPTRSKRVQPHWNQARCAQGVSVTECEVVRMVNDERRKRGLSALSISSQCTNFAKNWSQSMARTGRGISHNRIEQRARKFKLMQSSPRQTYGENVAGGQRSAREVMRGWMNSPGHRRNILNPSFRKIGVALAINRGSRLKTYWTQCFH